MKTKSPCEIIIPWGAFYIMFFKQLLFFSTLTSTPVAKEGIHVLKLKSLGFYK